MDVSHCVQQSVLYLRKECGPAHRKPHHGACKVFSLFKSSYRQFDTPCLFGRNIAKFSHFVHAWYGSEMSKIDGPNVNSFPENIFLMFGLETTTGN